MHETVIGAPAPTRGRVERVAIVSAHTSPLDQPGSGDSGGMNVLVRAVAGRLAARGLHVDVFTRRTAASQRQIVTADPGVRVVHLEAGPIRPLPKDELPSHLSTFLCSLLRFDVSLAAEQKRSGPAYDIIHSHYWLSGWVARLARERWGVPLVQSFHTLGRVKNLTLAAGDTPESQRRIAGEERVVQAADRVLVSAPGEGADLVRLYGARRDRVRVIAPGVDTAVFSPGSRREARRRLGLDARPLIVFAGRLQPLKGPDVAVRALGGVMRRRPDLDPVLAIVGGPSGSNGTDPGALRALASELGVGDRVRLVAPLPHRRLRFWYRAADAVVVPSRSESFGLVALEAAACGTPVVAADVGGLRVTIRDGETGFLVDGHDPDVFAAALIPLLDDPGVRVRMGAAAARFASHFDWDRSAAGILAVYEEVAGAPRKGGAGRRRR